MLKGLAVLVSILAVHSWAAAQIEDGNLIVPGERIGAYKLGVTGAALREHLGPPQNLGPGANPTLAATGWTFGPPGQRWALVALVRRATDQVVALLLQGTGDATRFRTAEGVALGTSLQTAWQVYGTPSFRWLLSDRTGFIVAVYDRSGLAIGGYTQLGVPLPVPANTVYYVRVFPAGSADDLWPASQIPRMP
ncbi:MAG: hypothetical protein QN131_09045 [Armatimonadota bacterium]|nr:hypothetical protein [Armatimonadota bacterium]MDR7550065.1 hypothetical protein [Armatimonadota bacterium]